MNALTNLDIAEAAQAHCTRVAAGDHWPDPATQTTEHSAVGETMATHFHVCKKGETMHFDAGLLGEEVGAILEGQFDILAADEAYCLSAGEAILIPPQEARRFQCLSERGVLYRVAVLQKTAEAAVAPATHKARDAS